MPSLRFALSDPCDRSLPRHGSRADRARQLRPADAGQSGAAVRRRRDGPAARRLPVGHLPGGGQPAGTRPAGALPVRLDDLQLPGAGDAAACGNDIDLLLRADGDHRAVEQEGHEGRHAEVGVGRPDQDREVVVVDLEQIGRRWIVGAAVGGVAGGIIGNKMDRQAEKIKSEIPGAKVERIGEGIEVTFDENNPDGSKAGVYFETNKYNISANSKLALNKLQKIFTEYPDTDILVEGHTDDVGTDAYNMKLSEKRARAVGDYLWQQGIPYARMIIHWYGESQPKVTNDSDTNRALNRRVQFVITANEKMKTEAKEQASKN